MNKHVVYVPEAFVPKVQDLALHMAGGVTLSPGHTGLWKAPDGHVHVDKITLVTIFEESTETLAAVADVLFAGGEQSVAYETNGAPALVGAPA